MGSHEHDGEIGVNVADFEPLGPAVEQAMEESQRNATLILGKWMTGEVNLGTDAPQLQRMIRDWLLVLTVQDVEGLIAAATALITKYILDADQERAEIKQASTLPYLQILAKYGSILADDYDLTKTDNVRVSDVHIARRIARRCDLSLDAGVLAWRLIAATLPVLPDILPGLHTRTDHLDIVEVTLVPEPADDDPCFDASSDEGS